MLLISFFYVLGAAVTAFGYGILNGKTGWLEDADEGAWAAILWSVVLWPISIALLIAVGPAVAAFHFGNRYYAKKIKKEK